MRCLALATLLALALPASAQTDLADGAGGYVAIQELSFGSGGGYLGVSGDVTLGWRRASGLDYGLRVGGGKDESFGSGSVERWSGFSAGPALGYTRALGRSLLGRVEGAALYRTSSYSASGEADVYDADPNVIGTAGGQTAESRSLAGSVTAAVSRPVRLVGSVRLHPTLGGFASASAPLHYENSSHPAFAPSAEAVAGVHVGLPLSFRLFGQDVAVVSHARIALAGGARWDRTGTYAGGGLRLNF